MRTAVRMLLERLGWTVREAVSGDDALRQLRAAPHEVDVVLSDVLMPGLHGVALVEALRAARPDLPIVFLSGYVEDRGTYRELLDAGLEILAKPPQSAALAAGGLGLKTLGWPAPARAFQAPAPPASGQSVAAMRFEPRAVVRVGLIGHGGRGAGLLNDLLGIPATITVEDGRPRVRLEP